MVFRDETRVVRDVYKAVQLIKQTADLGHTKAKHHFRICQKIKRKRVLHNLVIFEGVQILCNGAGAELDKLTADK